MDWTWVRSPAPSWGIVSRTNFPTLTSTHEGSGLQGHKCRGKNAGVAWAVNFNNGNCNNNNLNNNNYVRAVR